MLLALLPKLFEEMIELCKMVDNNIALLTIACYSSSEITNFVTKNNVNIITLKINII
jgi:hypothetical protein